MDQNLPSNLRLWRKPAVVSRRLPDKTVLLDEITGQCFELNELGAEVWTLLNGERTLEQICALLLPTLRVPEPTLTHDVQAFVAQLRAAGLADRAP
jgi:hypothetical protein